MGDEALVAQIATMTALGKGYTTIAKELDLTHNKTKRLMNSPECREMILRIQNDALKSAKDNIRKGVAVLADQIIETLRKHLEENNLNAIPHALKILGFNENEQSTGDSVINVILPSAAPVTNITPEYKEVPTDGNIE